MNPFRIDIARELQQMHSPPIDSHNSIAVEQMNKQWDRECGGSECEESVEKRHLPLLRLAM